MKRIALWLGCALLAVLLSLLFFAGDIAGFAVNRVLPQFLGVGTSAGKTGISLFGGKVSVRELEIGNLPGYDSPYMLRIEKIDMDFIPWSLMSGRPRFRTIEVSGVSVQYDGTLASSNISSFLALLESRLASPAREKPEKKGKGVEIDLLKVCGISAKMKIGPVSAALPLPDIVLRDIGRDGAMMPLQVVSLVMRSLAKGVISAATSAGSAAKDGVLAVGAPRQGAQGL